MDIQLQISNAVEAYRASRVSIDQFEDSFRNIAQGLFSQPLKVRDVLLVIENLLAELRADYISDSEFRQELAAAIRPFEERIEVVSIGAPIVWSGEPKRVTQKVQIETRIVAERIPPQFEWESATGSIGIPPWRLPGNTTVVSARRLLGT